MSKEINSGLNMYEFNRMNMGKLPLLEDLSGAKETIKSFISKKATQYYMLLNHDNRYFTLFNFSAGIVLSSKIELMGEDVIECLQNCNFGIIDIFEDEVGAALEIWVKDLETEAVYMYLLFPYDYGVIEY